MTRIYLCVLIAFLSAITLSAQTPTIGTYPNTTVVAGQNVTVTPSAAPTNTTWMVVSSSTNFKGVLTATTSNGVVKITDAMHAGVYTITVKAAQPFASASTTFQLTVTNPTCSQGLFRFSNTVSGQSGLHSVAVGDFNNDGIQDMAMANSTFGSISVRLGNGTGGFTGTTELGAGTTRYLAIGDVNCDGNQDIVNSNVNGAALYVHLGNGLGGFSAPSTVTVSAFPTGVSIGDFNNDGFMDLAAGTSGTAVSICLGNGTGSFSAAPALSVSSGAAWTPAIGDFNEDGNQDLAITNGATVAIRLGNGAGGFTGSTNVPVGFGTQTVIVADFNNDANQDFAVTNLTTGSVSVRLGDGLGGFSGTTELAIGSSTLGLAAGDFNGDGNTDLAINRFSGMMYIRYGDGMGGFTGTTSFSALTSSIRTVAAGDFNSDGFQDLAIAAESGGIVPIFLGGAAEINITGSSNTIVDGDVTPSATDGTYFGANCGASGAITKTFVIQNTGLTTLDITNVGISGPGAGDYNITVLPATTLAPAATTSFQIQFTPSAQGVQNATISVYNTDCNEAIYDFAISAVSANAVSLVPMGETDITCTGSNNGTAAVGVSGGTAPYTYDWSPGNPAGDGTSGVTGLTVGTWSVLVTDVSGCSATLTYSITQPTPVSGSTVVTNVNCYGGNTGAINLTPSGGTGSYTYSWNPGGQTTEDRTNVVQGTYTVTITDANSCTGTVTATVTQPATPVSGTTVVTNVSCFGGSTGAIDLTPAGGTGPYIYQWLPMGPYTQDRTGLTAGTYTVWILDAYNCFASVTATVTQPSSAITANISSTPAGCTVTNGTATVSGVTGGTPGYTYSWSPSGGTAAVATGLAAGGYTCTITDNSGCTITRSVTVAGTPSPSLALSAFSDVNCFGGNTGIVGVAPAFGGTAPYSYDWTPGTPVGDGTRQINNLIAGTYTCTVTDANGCTGTFTHVITQPSSPVSGTTVITNVVCSGGSNGTINLTPSGGTGPYTFNWLPSGPTSEDRTGLTQGTYSVQITDSRGCTGTVTANVTQPSPVSGSTTVTNVSCNGGSNGAINLTPAGGTGPYTYFWAPTITVEDPLALTAGTYTVLITDANGCTGTASAIVTAPAPIGYSFTQTNVSCNGGNNGSATITPSGGTAPYTYGWSSGGTGQTETGLAAGTYSFIITDANMCTTAAVPVTISEPSAVTVSGYQVNVTCFAVNTGYAEVAASGGVGSYSYLWSTGATAEYIYDQPPGTYSVVATDANGCTGSATFVITGPSSALTATMTHTNITCFGAHDGSATVTTTGGVAPYSYAWLTGGTSQTETGLAPGWSQVNITDAAGCQIVRTAFITEPPVLSNVMSQTNVSCNGGGNGTATATVSGGTAPYTYAWSSGGTAATETGLSAGSYSVTITDANACTTTTTFTITEPTAITFSTTHTDVLCNGGNNGEATVIVSGGTAPYFYSWTSGGTAATETGLTAGNYSVHITDANSCSTSATVTIAEPAALGLIMMRTNVNCNGGNTGDATVIALGGTAPYTYLWSSGGTASVESGLTAGTYSVLVTDANSCTSTASVTITEPTAITWTMSQTDVTCSGGNDATATVNVSGGTAPFAYAWSSGGTNATESGLSAGNYSVLITDANGCSTTASVTLVEPSAIVLTTTSDSVNCYSGNDGSATVTASGGAGYYTYAWNSGGTGATETGLSAGTYTVTVTDINGCSAQASVTVDQPDMYYAIAYTQSVSCFGGNDGSAFTIVIGGTAPYTYAWSSGSITSTENGLTAGTYTLVVTDAHGCTTSATFTVTEPAPLVATVNSTNNPTTCGATDGNIFIDLSGSFSYPTFQWSNGANSMNLLGVGAGSYTFTVTNWNGCSATVSATLTEPTPPVVTVSLPMDTVCGSFPGTITLSGETPAGGTWSGNTVSGNSFDPFNAGAGIHYITYAYTDTNGCTGIATDSLVVDLCMDIETATAAEWNLYPNPTSGSLTLNTPGELNGDVIIEIYTADGKLVSSENKQQAAQFTIDITGEPAGTYFIRITANEQVSVKRVVKL